MNAKKIKLALIALTLLLSSMACNVDEIMKQARQESCQSNNAYSTCSGNLQPLENALDQLNK